MWSFAVLEPRRRLSQLQKRSFTVRGGALHDDRPAARLECVR